MNGNPKVSALVSTYKAEAFLPGCLDDLLRQTMVDRLEIVVVNSGSPEGEDDIVREYMQRTDNILYVRTPQRESLYKAWNRAIMMSSGEYITNANVDDSHRADALQVMADTLDEHPEAGGVYAERMVTYTPHETFEENTAAETIGDFDYSRGELLRGMCLPGPQPMWRHAVHREFGLFDERLESAGDLEFWLRMTQKYPFVSIKEPLGLYLKTPEGIQRRDPGLSDREARVILQHYRQAAAQGVAVGPPPNV